MILSNPLKSTHIIGGEIFYDCLGNSRFRITLKIYRDCLNGEAPFDDPLALSVFDADGRFIRVIPIPYPGSVLVPPQNLNPCYRENASLCVEEAVYSIEETFPFRPGGYTLAYQRCCRNESILNINAPGEAGSTYTISIPETAWNTCNSSPRFELLPPIILCVNDPIFFNSSAIDPDGDSLVYAFCDPHDGGSQLVPMPIPASAPPYGYVNFRPPFSAIAPVSSNPLIEIHPVTGLITGKPDRIGQYVMAVCVSEYRNGTLLSQNLRDFQFNVLNCTGASTAEFQAPGALIENGKASCKGLEITFNNLSSNATYYLWDFGVPNTTGDQSSAENPVFVYPDTGLYNVKLYTNPGYSCGDTANLQIAVYHQLLFNIITPPPLCLTNQHATFRANGDIPSGANYFWTFYGPAQPTWSNDTMPENIVWSDTGSFQVKLSVSTKMCEAFDSAQVNVFPPLSISFEIEKLSTCVPAIISITDSSIVSPGALYQWDFGDGSVSTAPSPVYVYNTPGTYNLQVNIQNTIACRDSFSQSFPAYITVKPRPLAALLSNPQEVNILHPEIQFSDSSKGASGTWLYPGDGNQINQPNTLYTYADTGYYKAYLVAVNEQGCYDTSQVLIRIKPHFAIFFPNAFTPDGDSVNDTFKPRGEGFSDYSLRIFSRWGEELFLSNDPNEGWNGTVKSGEEQAPVGVYIYHVRLKDTDARGHTYVGHVLLLQ